MNLSRMARGFTGMTFRKREPILLTSDGHLIVVGLVTVRIHVLHSGLFLSGGITVRSIIPVRVVAGIGRRKLEQHLRFRRDRGKSLTHTISISWDAGNGCSHVIVGTLSGGSLRFMKRERGSVRAVAV